MADVSDDELNKVRDYFDLASDNFKLGQEQGTFIIVRWCSIVTNCCNSIVGKLII